MPHLLTFSAVTLNSLLQSGSQSASWHATLSNSRFTQARRAKSLWASERRICNKQSSGKKSELNKLLPFGDSRPQGRMKSMREIRDTGALRGCAVAQAEKGVARSLEERSGF